MNKKTIFLFSFLFLFSLISFSSAIGDISGVPNINLGLDDFATFDIDSYATGHINSGNVITFINPQNGAGVSLFAGQSHQNNRFSISLGTAGQVQIASYDIEMSNRDITICVGNGFNTEDCDTFSLSISEEGGQVPQQIASLNVFNLSLQSYNINLNNFITGFNRFSISYPDDYLAQSIFMQRTTGQSSISSSGGIYSAINFENGIANLILQSTSRNFLEDINLTFYNDYGQYSLNSSAFSSSAQQLNVIPIQTQSYIQEYTQPLGEFLDINIIGLATQYTYASTVISTIPQIGTEDFELYCSPSILINEPTPLYTSINTPLSFNISNLQNGLTRVISYEEFTLNIFPYFSNTDPICGYTGTSHTLSLPNITVHFTDNIGSLGSNVEGSSFMKNLVNQFNEFFPDKDDLTSNQRWTYTIVALLLIPIIFILLSVSSKGSFDVKMATWIAFVFDILLFIYFIAIGYISTLIIILFILIALLIIFLRSRGG